MQENLNKCLKHNIFLEYELETERFNKSRIRMELDTLTTMMNKYNKIDKSNSEFDTKVLIHDRQNLINKMCKIQVCTSYDKKNFKNAFIQLHDIL